MKYLGELAFFLLGLSLVTGLVFALLLAGGSALHLRTSSAALLALLAVFFWIPAFANIHLAVRITPATKRERVSAASRALGMLLCSAAVGTGFLFAGVGLSTIAPVFIAGVILNFGTLAFDK